MDINSQNKFQNNYLKAELKKQALQSKSKNCDLPNTKQNFVDSVKGLYDSGWSTPGRRNPEGVWEGSTDITFNVNFPYALIEAEVIPFTLTYRLSTILDIDENYLPFIKPIVLIKKSPNITLHESDYYSKSKWDDDYYTVYGDSTLIYKGNTPGESHLSEEERINGDFNSSLCSKWFFGSLSWKDHLGNVYEMRNGYMVSARTQYDYVENPPASGHYDYKKFECEAFDGVGSSTINGTGTLTEVLYGLPSVATKNVTMSAPIFEKYTLFDLSGTYYINGVEQSFYTVAIPKTVLIDNDAGDVKLSFGYSWTSSALIKFWKLFYSTIRANQVRFLDTYYQNRVLRNLPATVDYQSGTLPYIKITLKENPTGYPLVDTETKVPLTQYKFDRWEKIADNKYAFKTNGTFLLSGKNTVLVGSTREFVDEDYSQSAGTYARDSENRDDQTLPSYMPDYGDTQIKLMLLLKNPFMDNSTNNLKIS